MAKLTALDSVCSNIPDNLNEKQKSDWIKNNNAQEDILRAFLEIQNSMHDTDGNYNFLSDLTLLWEAMDPFTTAFYNNVNAAIERMVMSK